MGSSRIPRKPSKFVPFMDTTDDEQMRIVPPSTEPNSIKWGWSPDDITHWSAFRMRADLLFPLYSDKSHKDKETKDEMMTLIKEVEKYDHDPVYGKHLLEKVLINGTLNQCELFNIVRGTTIAKVASRKETTTGNNIPSLTIRKNSEGEHLLAYYDTKNPKSRAMPKGVKFCKICRLIGTAAPTNINQYQFIGNGKRGLFKSDFANLGLNPNVKMWAWYIAYYESTSGVLGAASPALKVGILLQDQSNPVSPTTTTGGGTTPGTT